MGNGFGSLGDQCKWIIVPYRMEIVKFIVPGLQRCLWRSWSLGIYRETGRLQIIHSRYQKKRNGKVGRGEYRSNIGIGGGLTLIGTNKIS